MIDKRVDSVAQAVADIFDGATVMIGGFGEAGSPIELIHALIDLGVKDLTVVNNNTGSGHVGLAALIENKQVAKMICCAGIPAFYTATSVGTPLAEGKEVRGFDSRDYAMEYGLKADFALVKCARADRYGNLVYNKTARNFGPIMAMAANTTIVQCGAQVEVGEIDPEIVVTPGIFVDRIVTVSDPAYESRLVNDGRTYP